MRDDGRVIKPLYEEHGGKKHQRDDDVGNLAVVQRGDAAKLVIQADAQALVAAGEIEILDGLAKCLGEAERDDGEVVAAQPQAG